MDGLIALAIIGVFVAAIVYLFIYVNTPSQFDPNSAIGRMENRFKREQEQMLYSRIVMPLLQGIGILILVGIGGCVACGIYCLVYRDEKGRNSELRVAKCGLSQ